MKELRPVHLPKAVADRIEILIKQAFRRLVYVPLLAELAPDVKLKNAKGRGLAESLRSGRVTYSSVDGVFRGTFDAETSKELKAIGCVWDRALKAWRVKVWYRVYFDRGDGHGWQYAGKNSTPELAEKNKEQVLSAIPPRKRGDVRFKVERAGDIPPDVRELISTASLRFEELADRLDERLRKILPAEIAGKDIFADLFDKAAGSVDNNIRKSLDSITVLPELSRAERRQIAEEWGENLSLYIRDFADSEILRLRRQIQKNVMSGNRYQQMVQTIHASYGVTAAKARFLARQETNLLTTALKKQRYLKAGVPEYRWACVHNPHDKSPTEHVKGNVRWSHAQLNGKIFRWDDPPVSTAPGEPVRRCHPGQDFNCRCAAIPVLRRPGA